MTPDQINKLVNEIPDDSEGCKALMTSLLAGVCKMAAFSCCIRTDDRDAALLLSHEMINELRDILLKGTQRCIHGAYDKKARREANQAGTHPTH